MATHIDLGCTETWRTLIPAPAYLFSSTVDAGNSKHTKVAGAGSNYRDSGACTFGLFLHDLQRLFDTALLAKGKAGRAGRH